MLVKRGDRKIGQGHAVGVQGPQFVVEKPPVGENDQVPRLQYPCRASALAGLTLGRQQPNLIGRRYGLRDLGRPTLPAHGNHGQDHDGEKGHGERQGDFRHCISAVAARHGHYLRPRDH